MPNLTNLAPGVYRFPASTLSGTPISPSVDIIPTFIGQTLGRQTQVLYEEVMKSAGDDTLDQLFLLSGIGISDTDEGAYSYLENIDYEYDVDVDTGVSAVHWLTSRILDPSAPTYALATGVVAAGDYDFLIRAIDAENWGVGDPAKGTKCSATLNVTLADSLHKIVLTWASLRGAAGYAVYQKLHASAADKWKFVATTNTNTYTITTTPTDGALSPAAWVNETLIRPKIGVAFYVSYYYSAFTYNTPVIYYSLDDVKRDHGVGSQLSIAAEFAMSTVRGNSCQKIVCVGVAADTDVAYQDALNSLGILSDELLIVPLRANAIIWQSLQSVVDARSTMEMKQYSHGIAAPWVGMPDGDESTADTMRYAARSLNSPRMVFVCPGFYQMTAVVQGTDGTFEEQGMAHYYVAAAVTAACAAQRDTAEPMTWKKVRGFKSYVSGTLDAIGGLAAETIGAYPEIRLEQMRKSGCLVIELQQGNFAVRHAVTTSLNSVEEQEWSIQLTDDYLTRQLIGVVRKFVGKKNTAFLRSMVTLNAGFILDQAVSEEKITSYSELRAYQDVDHPTYVWIEFVYVAMYPANVFIFKFGFDTVPA